MGVNGAHGCLTSSPQPARPVYSAAALQPGLEAAGEAGALPSPQKLNRPQGWPCLLLLGAEWTDSHLTWEGSVPQPERSVRWGSHSCLSILAGDTLSPWPHLHQLTMGPRGWGAEEVRGRAHLLNHHPGEGAEKFVVPSLMSSGAIESLGGTYVF